MLEHRIPPPLIGLVLALGMWAAAYVPPALPIPPAVRPALSAVLAAAGVCFDLLGIAAFRRRRTTVNPLRPANASALVTSGVYRVTRNPMYLGMLLLLCAWAVHLAALWPLLALPAFVAYMNRFQIAPEEAILQDKFGAEFSDYAARVRRWL